MEWFGNTTTMLVLIAIVWPEAFGEQIAKIVKGYKKGMKDE